jgi:hypothetical protein
MAAGAAIDRRKQPGDMNSPSCGRSSGDDPAENARIGRIFGKRLPRKEVSIDLDGQAEATPNGSKLGQADIAKFRIAKAKIAKAIGAIRLVRIDLGKQPGCVCVGREELDDWEGIDAFPGSGSATVGE